MSGSVLSNTTPVNMLTSINSTLAPNTQLKEPSSLRIIRLTFQTILFLGGLIGNILICLVTSKKRRGKTSTGNLLILHLAVSDLGILLVCFPFVVIRSEIPYSWPFGRVVCKTIYPFSDIFYGVEIGCITAIAFHRYRMLVHCNKVQMTVDMAKKVVFLIWFFAFLLIVVPMFFVMDIAVTPSRTDCLPKWPNALSRKLFGITPMLVFYVIPLTIILLTYVKIRAALRRSNERQNSYRRPVGSSSASSRRSEPLPRISQNRRAIQILTPVVLVFAFTMLPFNIFRVLVVFDLLPPTNHIQRVLFHICSVLLMANSSVNPVIYSVVNSEFRRELSNLVRCKGDSWSNDSDAFLTINRSSNSQQNHNGEALLHLEDDEDNDLSSLSTRCPFISPSSRRFARDRKRLWHKISKSSTSKSTAVTDEDDGIELQTAPFVISVLVSHETGGF